MNNTGLADLNDLEILQGSFTLTFVLISIILGLIILLKFFSLRKKELIFVGLAWIFLSSAWWGSSFSFLFIVLFDYTFEPFLFLFISNVFIPVAVVCWMYTIGHLMYPESKKIIVSIFLTISILYEIVLISLLIIDPALIGTIKGTFYYQPELIPMVFQMFALLVTIVTGILFSSRSLKSSDLEVKWKARFLLFGFILFTIGAGMDAAITLTPLTLVIVRLLLIISSIFYFLGFLLPDRISKLLIAEK
ncbi:MAG: hypothetical protein ACTSRI_02170 [Promethearchaeota archaeon]